MATIKQLSSFLVLNVGGGDRVSYTYDEVDAETGELVQTNVKESFFIVDEEMRAGVEAVRKRIRETKLS